MGQLSGRGAVVTGASRGLGRAIATALVDAGADLMICARTAAELDVARDDLAARAAEGQRVSSRRCDIADERQVEALFEAVADELPNFDILVSNAGGLGPLGPVTTNDIAQWRAAVEQNLLGPFLLVHAAVPLMSARGRGSIIQISGGGATKPLFGQSAYAASKAGVVRLMENLAIELAGSGIEVNCIAPGMLDTRLLDQVLEAGPDLVGGAFHRTAQEARASGTTPPEQAARLVVHLAASLGWGVSGRLVSAVWDDWEHLPELIGQPGAKDLYTLRRVDQVTPPS